VYKAHRSTIGRISTGVSSNQPTFSFLFFIQNIQNWLDDLFKIPGGVKEGYDAKMKAKKYEEDLRKKCPECFWLIENKIRSADCG
jgi:hypothetical protein